MATISREIPTPAKGEPEALPWSDRIAEYAFAVPWFKHDDPAIIEDYAARLRAVAEKHAR